NLDGRPSSKRDFLQFVVCPKTDPLAIRRKEGSSGTLSPSHGRGLLFVEISFEKLSGRSAYTIENDSPAIRRQRDGRAARPVRTRAPNKAFCREAVQLQPADAVVLRSRRLQHPSRNRADKHRRRQKHEDPLPRKPRTTRADGLRGCPDRIFNGDARGAG